MPPRPAIKPRQARPVSAIYLGKASSPNLQDLTQSPHFSSAYPSLIDGTPPALPDLPEPFSPSSSVGSVKTGLPSPPATNSTGSGSTGDPATIRERPVSFHSDSSAGTSSSSHHTIAARNNNGPSSRSNSRLGNASQEDPGVEGDFDDDYDRANDNDNESNPDGDDTARLDYRLMSQRAEKLRASSDNVMALQRVRTLAQRNRLALDKLSRLGSPSPSRANTRSPAPSVASASSRPSHPRQPRTETPPQSTHDLGRSGSETERESTTNYTSHSHSSHSSSSHSRAYSVASSRHQAPTVSSSNRTSSPPPSTPQHNSPYSRHRHLSAPTSPNKARLVAGGSTISSVSNSNSTSGSSASSSSPSNRRRHRTSMASISQLQLADFEEEEDVDDDNLRTATGTRTRPRDTTLSERDLITQSALAAVASSRRSPVGARRRSALPMEFRSDLLEQSPSPRPGSAARRKNSSDLFESRDQADKEARWENGKTVEHVTPFRPNQNVVTRSSTLRETRRSGASPRWSSDDFRSPVTLRDRHYAGTQSTEELNVKHERRQSLRGGSAESALGGWSPGGRSLLGEGLRAAGLSKKRDQDRIRGEPTSSSATTASFRDKPRGVDWSPQDVLDQGRRRFNNMDRDRQRASTSMAHYQYLDGDDKASGTRAEGGRDLALRTHKSAYPLSSREAKDPSTSRRERDSLPPERASSSLSRYSGAGMATHIQAPAPSTPAHLLERSATASPFNTRRFTTPAGSNAMSHTNTEHTRLLIESLAMFEAQLAKLPPQLGASTSSSTGMSVPHADLTRNAQGAVYAAERLANILKLSSARALDAQVEAEVESAARDRSQDIIDIWGRVAADYREGTRAADELVRGLTSVLLGVGRIMRDLGSTASEKGSPAMYSRHMSLSDEEFEAQVGVASGRQSVASRTSWEQAPRDRDRDREEAFRRLDGATRSESVLARASPATFQRLKDREQFETPPSASQSSLRNSTSRTTEKGTVAGTFRRLFTPREQREQVLDTKMARDSPSAALATLDSQETVHGRPFEPSPTPASKTRPSPGPERPRTLTPLTIPKPLPALPSESAARRPSLSTSTNTVENLTLSQDSDRRKGMSIRRERPSFPLITSPSNPTTALTPHTVSTSGTDPAAFPLARTNSEKSARSQVTFSRSSTVSVSAALTGIQQQDGERNRTISTSSSNAEPSSSVIPDSIMRTVSGSETERDIKRNPKGGVAPRLSLDRQLPRERDERNTLTASGTKLSTSTVHPADRSAASSILHQSAGPVKRERRRTVTDIWPE